MNRISFTGKPIREGDQASLKSRIVFLLSLTAFSGGLTCVYLGMREIMRLGGFVASGGPYKIAHPAPDWVWVIPVSFILCMASIFVSLFAGGVIGGPNLMALSWSAMFISTGWNFLEFGFSPPVGEGLAWGWIICGVLFVPMGIIPLWLILKYFFEEFRSGKGKKGIPSFESENQATGGKWGRIILIQLAAVGIGIYLGLALFNSQAHAGKSTAAPAKPGTIPQISQPAFPPSPSNRGHMVELKKQGKTLSLLSMRDGSWTMVYQGQMYSRISQLPHDIRRLFRSSLENIQGIKK